MWHLVGLSQYNYTGPRLLSPLARMAQTRIRMLAHTRILVLALITLTSLHMSGPTTVGAQAVDVTVLSPETLNDTNGNTADSESNITYVDIPMSGKYKSEGKTSSDIGAIGALYDMAKSIADSSLPGDFPSAWVDKYKAGDIDIQNDWKEITSDYLGYSIALAIGIIFILVFPIVGMCFCCCRCCGRCGGSRTIKDGTEAGQDNRWGRVLVMSILGAFTTLILIGSILMFVTNGNLSSSLQDFHDKDVDKLDDLPEFFNSTIQQAEQLIVANFHFTLAVLFRDLDNIGYLLGTPIRDEILINTGLGQTYDSIDALDSDARILFKNLQILKANKQEAVEKAELFHSFTTDISTKVEDLAKKHSKFNTSVTSRNFVTSFNASKLPDEDNKILALNASISQGVSALTAESKKNLIDIPTRIQNETQKQRSDLKSDVNKYTKDISKIIDDLTSMKNDVLDSVNFNSLKDEAKEYTNEATKYDKYRWYGGLGLAIITMITGLLLALGILFGLFGGSYYDDPTERSNLSNSGGNMLIAGVIIIFIFGWLMMLVTTLVFAIGAPADKFVCGPAQDLSILDKLLEDNKLFGDNSGNGSWLGNKVYSGKNVVLKLSELMESCKNGKTVYVALKMEAANIFNLTEVTDYNKKFSIEDKLGNTVINFANITITTGPMMSFINIMKDFDSTMDYGDYNTTLSVHPVEPSKVFITELDSFISTLAIGSSLRIEFQGIADQFASNMTSNGTPLEMSIKNIQDALTKIKNTTQSPPSNNLTVRCDKLQNSLENVEKNLSINAGKSFNSSMKNFEARLTHIMDKFIDDMTNAVKNEVGICVPIWNLYSDLVVYGLCRSAIGSLNGWWCAVGWTTFFQVLSIVAAVKLSKHFRRMWLTTIQSDGKHYFKNKVYHSDMAGDS